MNKPELEKAIQKTMKDAYASLGAVIGDAPLEIQSQYAEDFTESAEKARLLSREYLAQFKKERING